MNHDSHLWEVGRQADPQRCLTVVPQPQSDLKKGPGCMHIRDVGLLCTLSHWMSRMHCSSAPTCAH